MIDSWRMIYNFVIYFYVVSPFQDDTVRFEYKIISGMGNNIKKCPSPYTNVFLEQNWKANITC